MTHNNITHNAAGEEISFFLVLQAVVLEVPCLWPPMPFLAREKKYRSIIARRCFSRKRYCVWQFSWLSILYCSNVSLWMAFSNCSSPGSDPQLHSWTNCWKRCRGLAASESFFSSWASPISPSFTISFHNFASPSSVKAACVGMSFNNE